MTPPVEERVIDARAPSINAFAARIGARPRLLAGDVVFLTDVWVVVAVLWTSRVVTATPDPAVMLFGVTALALLWIGGDWRHLGTSALDDAGRVLRYTWLAYALSSAASVMVGVGNLRALLAVATVSGPLLIAGRAASYSGERWLRTKVTKVRTLVVGSGHVAARVISALEEHDEYGLDVVGVADDDPKFEAHELGARVLGGLSDIPDLVRSHRVEVVIVTFSAANQAGMVEIIRSAMVSGAAVWVIPRFFELGSVGFGASHLWGLPVVRLNLPARSRPAWILKRALDFVVTGLGVLVLAPALAIIAALVYLDLGRPILLRQTRVGLDGRPFQLLKFRTMRLSTTDVEATEWSPSGERMTRVGRLLRDTSLDELPQLFNVLRGEMSLVGPRPERPYFVNLFSDLYPNYYLRHRLPAGITGWAQINGLRGDTSIEERAIFDNYYIENWSFAQDVKILLRTVLALFKR